MLDMRPISLQVPSCAFAKGRKTCFAESGSGAEAEGALNALARKIGETSNLNEFHVVNSSMKHLGVFSQYSVNASA